MGWTRGLMSITIKGNCFSVVPVVPQKGGEDEGHGSSQEIIMDLRRATDALLQLACGDREHVNVQDIDNCPIYSPEEVARHCTTDSLWIVIEDIVYDVTRYANLHPGGKEMFDQFAGKQCTWQFWRWHGKKILREWGPALQIGRVSPIPPNPYAEPPRWIKTS